MKGARERGRERERDGGGGGGWNLNNRLLSASGTRACSQVKSMSQLW